MQLRASLGVSLAIFLLLWLGSVAGLLPNDRTPATPAAGDRALAGKVIVVDPGHGGGDTGAIGVDGQRESANTLAIGLELYRLLQQGGAKVIMTRTDDSDPAWGSGLEGRSDASLAARVALAEQAHADAFVSVHNDWNANPASHGTTTYYERPESQPLAAAVEAAVTERLGSEPLGVRYGNYEVIRDTTMPAVLVEVGFLSNAEEAASLSEPAYRQRAAEGIYEGIRRYFAERAG